MAVHIYESSTLKQENHAFKGNLDHITRPCPYIPLQQNDKNEKEIKTTFS